MTRTQPLPGRSRTSIRPPWDARFLACTPAQRRAVADLLRHLVDARAHLADDLCVSDDTLCAIEIWSDPGPY
jgi:hypothetical protein